MTGKRDATPVRRPIGIARGLLLHVAGQRPLGVGVAVKKPERLFVSALSERGVDDQMAHLKSKSLSREIAVLNERVAKATATADDYRRLQALARQLKGTGGIRVSPA